MNDLASVNPMLETDLVRQITAQLEQPLPGRAAQRRFAHELSYGRHFGPVPLSARKAAVLALIFLRRGEWRLALTRRPEHLANHSGQICFPGGVLEAGESGEAAAARECQEELGIPADEVKVLGGMTSLYVFATRFLVHPFVATCPADPCWQPSEAEVAEVVEVPLSHLICRESIAVQTRRDGSVIYDAPVLCWQEHRIWGATAMMLGELVDVVGRCRPIAE